MAKRSETCITSQRSLAVATAANEEQRVRWKPDLDELNAIAVMLFDVSSQRVHVDGLFRAMRANKVLPLVRFVDVGSDVGQVVLDAEGAGVLLGSRFFVLRLDPAQMLGLRAVDPEIVLIAALDVANVAVVIGVGSARAFGRLLGRRHGRRLAGRLPRPASWGLGIGRFLVRHEGYGL